MTKAKILLDTHVWIWMNSDPDRLARQARHLLIDRSNELYVSTASVWEMAIKVQLGKLTLPQPVDRFVVDRLTENQITSLAIQVNHALRAADLPSHHRDPFDRMLVAQAQTEGMQLMTADRQLAEYTVEIVDAIG